ncbi:MAG: FAD-binding protein [Spirochaetaceae bacterium]|nr:FAD-binding protein [Spirochaetaceae bacterium]
MSTPLQQEIPGTSSLPHRYGRVTPSIMAELQSLLGQDQVFTDPDKLQAYSHDETSIEDYGHQPEVVVFPRSTQQVADLVLLANRYRIPLTPRGAGSGLSGGAIPLFGGIVVSLEKMQRVRDIDYENMTITVEAGMVTNDINNVVRDHGLFYAGYPMSLETCTIGGNIAENAGGGKAVKYGVTSRYVLGLELVTPSGEVVRLGGKLAKDVTGYDLVHLIVGSEGTLGIVTAATLRLIGLPKATCDLLVLYATPQAAISSVPTILTNGLVPTAIEFMDRSSVEASCRYLNESLPYETCGAMLLIEMDGSDQAQVEHDAEAVGELCLQQGALEVYVADNRTTRERVWSVRRNIAEAFKVYSPVQSLEDIVVPPARIPDILPTLAELEREFGITIPCYGHAGDGNLHATLVNPPDMDMERWHAVEHEALEILYAAVTQLGGKISGEHGIGLKRKRYMAEFMDPVELKLIKAIKQAWDPLCIMNPGKLFDPE